MEAKRQGFAYSLSQPLFIDCIAQLLQVTLTVSERKLKTETSSLQTKGSEPQTAEKCFSVAPTQTTVTSVVGFLFH